MTANAEARSLLDQLMGADRDAPLPSGAALPRNSKRPLGSGTDGGGGMILPSSNRKKSCYDRDIDPLYCAWGLDVYDLFVNTKSDLGLNPYTVDEAARKEYLSLPKEEQDRLGFDGQLFVKLQELVQHCDRTVARNQDKLNRELQRQSQKRGGHDYVVDVNEGAVEELLRTEIRVQEMKSDLKEALETLSQVRANEEAILEEQRQEQKKKLLSEKPNVGSATEEDENDPSSGAVAVANNEESQIKVEGTLAAAINDAHMSSEQVPVKTESTLYMLDKAGVKEDGPGGDEFTNDGVTGNNAALEELGRLTLVKQGLLCQIANIMSQIGPLEDSIEIQYKNLNYVKSDTTTDKTVCEVSGNFMSARDADERIAAHYAGKQYVGWKLVRDKFQELVKKYGKYGPPRAGGGRGNVGGGGPPLLSHQQYQQQQTQQRRDGAGAPRGGPAPYESRGGDRRGSRDGRFPGGHNRGYEDRGYDDRGYDDRGYDRRRGSDHRSSGGGGGGSQYRGSYGRR
jgi:LUC7 N_terminus